MSDVPIIGENTTAPPPDDASLTMFDMAVLVVQDETGECFFVDPKTPIDTFRKASSADAVSMARHALDRYYMQRQAATTVQTQVDIAARMQAAQAEAQANRAVMEHINRKGAM